MKKVLSCLLVCCVLTAAGCGRKSPPADPDGLSGTVTVSGAWALYPMTVKWAEEFRKIHPNVKIDVAAGGAGKGVADCLAGVVDIGMVSRDINPAETEKGAWWVAVTKDAVVPTISRDNPVAEELFSKGVKRETFADIWIKGNITTWGQIVGGAQVGRINVYTRSDACGAAETWAGFLGGKQEDLLGVGVYGDPGLAEAVIRDRLGIGYNNVNYVYDANTKAQIAGVSVLPVDFNGNGRIDPDENFYATRDDLTRAIAEGRFHSPPARDLYFVCKGRPDRKVVVEFIKWVLADGQKFIHEAGYINVSEQKIQEGLNKLEQQ